MRGKGNYSLSFYCECGVTLHYSGIEEHDAQSRSLVDAIIDMHAEWGHYAVSASEARRIRRSVKVTPERRRQQDRARTRQKHRKIQVQASTRWRRVGSQGRPTKWHALVRSEFGGTQRTACGLAAPDGSVEHRALQPGPQSCSNCIEVLADQITGKQEAA